jgi:putative SOS response-associated peptidase YedK
MRFRSWRKPGAGASPARALASITTDATSPAGEIHDRIPLILPPERVTDWLDPNLTDTDEAAKLLHGITVAPMEVRPVSRDVNHVGANRPDLINPIEDAADAPLQLALA